MMTIIVRACVVAAGIVLLDPRYLCAQQQAVVWSDQEKPILQQLRELRQLSDDARARTTKQLALQIRELSVSSNRLRLATALSSLATEGDFGHDTLQEVATTLAEALRAQPVLSTGDQRPYVELARLVRYEHVRVDLDAPALASAISKLEAEDSSRERVDFTLTDVQGKTWTLQAQRGKVVLVNFWATWCQPCRREMPDLDKLYRRFGQQGLVILAISDEDAAKVKPFVAERNVTYPILLDQGRTVHALFHIDGIPKSFVYDRQGKLVAQAIDMRTEKQFLEMLGRAGLQ